MVALKVIDSYREELNTKCIVICTYKTLTNVDVDCIDYSYFELYPEFEVVEVQEKDLSLF
jgi:hypothetical protein